MIEVQKNQTAHEHLIPYLCSLIGARTYLELGVYDGACLFKVAEHVPGIKVVGVDLRPLPFIPVNKNVTFVLSDTTAYLRGLTDEKFDVVFIDANHEENNILTDLDWVFPHVSDHGLIFLHDTFPMDQSWTTPELCGSAYKVPRSLGLLGNVLEFVTLPYHPGLTIIRKRTTQTIW